MNRYERHIDIETINDVLLNLDTYNKLRKEYTTGIGKISYSQLCEKIKTIDNTLYEIKSFIGMNSCYTKHRSRFINEKEVALLREDYDRLQTKKREIEEKAIIYYGSAYTKESCKKAEEFETIIYKIKKNYKCEDGIIIIPHEVFEMIDKLGIKGIRKEQNLTKIVYQICKHYGVDKTYDDYSYQMKRLGDVVIPNISKVK